MLWSHHNLNTQQEYANAPRPARRQAGARFTAADAANCRPWRSGRRKMRQQRKPVKKDLDNKSICPYTGFIKSICSYFSLEQSYE